MVRSQRQLETNCPNCGEKICIEQTSQLAVRLLLLFFGIGGLGLGVAILVEKLDEFIVELPFIEMAVTGFFTVLGAFFTFLALKPDNMLTATWQGTCSACDSIVKAEFQKEHNGVLRQVTTLLKAGTGQTSQTIQADKTLPEDNVTRQAAQKIEIEFEPGKTLIYDSSAELRDAILNGEVNKSLRAKTVLYEGGNPKPNENWSTVEKMAMADSELRSLYRPVWDCTLNFLVYGIVAGIALKAIDTTVTTFALGPEMGILWLLLIGAHLLSVKWGPSIPMAWIGLLLLSFGEGMPNFPLIFFMAGLSTALVGFIFGAPSGMVIGTVIGHFKRRKVAKAPDAAPEGGRPYLLGIILPLVLLTVLIPLYLWFNIRLFEWL